MTRVLRRAARILIPEAVLVLACSLVWEVAQRIRDRRVSRE